MDQVKIVGLKTYLYTFKKYEDYINKINQLKGKGEIEEIFLNNKWAFEIKLYKKIG